MANRKHLDFANRLKEACDQNPNVPSHGYGLLGYIAKKLEISEEAVRKYVEGESRPRPKRMTELAKVIDADEAWLALGITPTLSKQDKKQLARNVDASVLLVNAVFTMNGYSCAYSDEENGVDINAIRKGHMLNIGITTARFEEDKCIIMIKPTFENHLNIVVVPRGKTEVDYLILDSDFIEEHAERRGGYLEIAADSHRGLYSYQGEDLEELGNSPLL